MSGKHHSSLFSYPFSTTWRKALVSLPRLVPDHALYLTSPDGPRPFVVKLPSYHPKNHDIPCYVFVYVPPEQEQELYPAAKSKALAKNAQGSHLSDALAESLTVATVSAKGGLSQTSTLTATSTETEARTLCLPVLVDFHGGSFILGTPQEQAPFCAQMAREIGATASGGGCVVISVDYRLGPYAHYPAANEDAEDVLKAVLNPDDVPGKILREGIRRNFAKLKRDEWVDIDTNRIAISGFSSGGNMALGLAISVKNDPTINRDWPSVIPKDYPRGIPLVLFYPSLDSRLLPDERPRPPGLDPPAGFFTRLKIESELMPKYMPAWQRAHPRASPGLADIKDGGLHPKAKMLLVLPELDSLSDQSLVWTKKVEEDGRKDDLEVVPVKGVMHGWTQFPDGWQKSEDDKAKK
jgi:acetyl esterase/lipase